MALPPATSHDGPEPDDENDTGETPETTPDDSGPPEFPDDLSDAELKQAVIDYSEWAVGAFDRFSPIRVSEIRFEISHKMKRAAGKAGGRVSNVTGEYDNLYLRIARGAYDEWGWNEDFRNTIRHELVHILQYQEYNDGGHGAQFKRFAGDVDAPRYCPQFTDYAYELRCKSCKDVVGGRHKICKAVREPHLLNTRCCSAGCEVRNAKESKNGDGSVGWTDGLT